MPNDYISYVDVLPNGSNQWKKTIKLLERMPYHPIAVTSVARLLAPMQILD
jgi:hypothetical protein